MSSGSSDSSYVDCAICAIAGSMEFTSCCHEPLCELCYEKYVFSECSVEGCEYSDLEMCVACLRVSNSWLCEVCEKTTRCENHSNIECDC